MLDTRFRASKYLFNSNDIELIFCDEHVAKLFPVIYILFDETTMLAYVGESTNAKQRLTTHLSHVDKKNLRRVYIISSKYLNKSAALDIESFLIQSIPSLGFKLLNGNCGIANHNYYQKEFYREIFNEIWPQLNFDKVPSKTLLEIENSDIFKYSPYKTLTLDQFQSTLEIIEGILSDDNTTTFVDGAAGTGKTILAIYAIKLLTGYTRYDTSELEALDDSLVDLLAQLRAKFPEGLRIGFVVPMTSLRNTLKSVFRGIYGLSSSMVIGPSDVVKKPYDLLVVDESHRLTQRVSITNYKAFDDTNKKLGLFEQEKCGTQLDWILNSSKHQILFYDSEQSIKPADVRKEDFDNVKSLSSSSEISLVSQLRSLGGKDYITFVDELLNTADTPSIKTFSSASYELILFSSMKDMVKQIQLKETEYGLSRLMSGYSWDWISRSDENVADAIIDGVKLTWNRVSSDWINSTTEATEMGCIHTVQGYDLNYAGVIFGEEIKYDEKNGRIYIDKSKYYDKKGKAAIKNDEELHGYIIKIYKTMMYRGIRGTYIYACDPALRSYFSNSITRK